MKAYKIPQIRLSYVADVNVEEKFGKSSDACAELLRSSFDEGEIDYRESFKVMYLSRSLKVLGIHTISMGGTSATPVDAKMIFSGALLANAQTIILCHNHPSGNLKPSPQDDNLTRRLVEAGKLLDLRITDHIILSNSGYYSYNDEGRI
ncbi:MAG: JAB domain-containing protein [Muribaculaceae bacterium]|nr:JAB domain-containing protein [Muribaculaceae bacterium]